MNSVWKISVAIAWLTVTSADGPSHVAGTLSTFSAAISPFIANAIDQLPLDSVNEITPHVEALASIAKGNDMYEFFQNVAQECHKYQNKLANKDERSAALEENKEAKIENNREEREKVSDSKKEPLNEEGGDVSNKNQETASEKEDPQASKKEDSEDQNNDQTNSEGSSSDDEVASGPKKVPNAKKPLRLKDLPEGAARRSRKNNMEVTLTKRGDKVIVATRKPGQQSQPREEVDITGKGGEQLAKKFVDKYTAAA